MPGSPADSSCIRRWVRSMFSKDTVPTFSIASSLERHCIFRPPPLYTWQRGCVPHSVSTYTLACETHMTR
eukprot:366003-Chlamydomonas_euryale.AAC.5